MIKLTYKEVKDNGVLETISKMKGERLPGKISYNLLKIHRGFQKECALIDEQLRAEFQKNIEHDKAGNIVKIPEEKNEIGKVIHPGQAFKYIEGGEKAHEKASTELFNVELSVPMDPIDLQFFIDRDIELACLAGLEPISLEYQRERALPPAGTATKLESVKN